MKHIVKISAASVEEFEKIFQQLNQLPEMIYNQIDTATVGISGLVCDIGYKSKVPSVIYVPNDVTQINPINDIIYIYTPSIIFRLDKDVSKQPIQYYFIKEK